MSGFIKPYNNDPFVGNLSTPVTTSTATKLYLGNLPIYRKGLSPVLRGLEIGMAHGYFFDRSILHLRAITEFTKCIVSRVSFRIGFDTHFSNRSNNLWNNTIPRW